MEPSSAAEQPFLNDNMHLKESKQAQGKPQGWAPVVLGLVFVAWAAVSLVFATRLDVLARPSLDRPHSLHEKGDSQALQADSAETRRKLSLETEPEPVLKTAEQAPAPALAPVPAPTYPTVPLLPFASMDEICPGIHSENLVFPQVALLPDVVPLPLAAAIIAAAEAHAANNGGWTMDRHANYPTTDQDTADIPALNYLIRNLVHSVLVPRMADTFGLNPLQLGISEVFIAKYSAEVKGHQRSLDPHLDGSDFSFVVALNDGFEGGGTAFVEAGEVRAPPAGSAVTFCGQNRHAGLPVTAGTRYILAGFMFFGEPGGCQAWNEDVGGAEEEREFGDEPGVVVEMREVKDVE